MFYLLRTIWTTVFLTVLFSCAFVSAQEKATILRPQQTFKFSLTPDETRIFTLQMKQDEFAEFTWLAKEGLILAFEITDSLNKKLETGDSSDDDNVLFIAPKAGEYKLVIKFDKSSELTTAQNIWLEYNNVFKLPTGTIQKDIRKINGYDVKIMKTPALNDEEAMSIFLIEKAGHLKKIMRYYGGEEIGLAEFYFGDDITKADTPEEKRSVPLVANTLDKTGDGIPDVMVNYFSGGGHCCQETYFINLGEIVETVDSSSGFDEPLVATAKNPKGGLYFELSETDATCWHLPKIFLSFVNGKLQPDFERMRKPLPSLATLKSKARMTRLELSPKPYLGLGLDGEQCELYKKITPSEKAFWSEMLNLMISGKEDLALQYFDLVWLEGKEGKEDFLKDFNKKLSAYPYWQLLREKAQK